MTSMAISGSAPRRQTWWIACCRALAVRCDVRRGEEVKAALDKTMEVFGRLEEAGLARFEMPKKIALLEHDFSIERVEAVRLCPCLSGHRC